MAKKRNSKKKRNAKPAEIMETIVKDLMPEATEDTVDMDPVVIHESKAVEVAEVIEAKDAAADATAELEATVAANMEDANSTTDTIVMEPVDETELSAPEDLESNVYEINSDEPEISSSPKDEVTDFTLVMDSTDVNKQEEAEYAAARAEGPAASTAITPIVPVTGYGDDKVPEGSKTPKERKLKGVFDKPVTRRFLTAALAAMLVLNGAIAAGIMALYSHSIKKDVSDVRQTVSELESKSENSGNFGNGGPGMGMTPPDLGYGDEWNGGDSWGGNGNYLGRDDDYNNDWDDWDDDDRYEEWNSDQYGSVAPYSEGNNGQQSASGPSIGIVISDNNGVYVTQVTGSNAQKAGFKEGDKILSFDGDDIDDSNELIEEVQEHKSGDTVKVVIERDGKQVKIETTLE